MSVGYVDVFFFQVLNGYCFEFHELLMQKKSQLNIEVFNEIHTSSVCHIRVAWLVVKLVNLQWCLINHMSTVCTYLSMCMWRVCHYSSAKQDSADLLSHFLSFYCTYIYVKILCLVSTECTGIPHLQSYMSQVRFYWTFPFNWGHVWYLFPFKGTCETLCVVTLP